CPETDSTGLGCGVCAKDDGQIAHDSISRSLKARDGTSLARQKKQICNRSYSSAVFSSKRDGVDSMQMLVTLDRSPIVTPPSPRCLLAFRAAQ
ncbi:7348_t:CDS:2, partial [Acaulospora colombiana]